MSRTYRLKNTTQAGHGFYTLESYLTDINYFGSNYTRVEVRIDPKSKEGKRRIADFHRDKSRSCKEPGPSWFRNLTSERRLRRDSKKQLQIVMKDLDFEYLIDSKPYLEYWT